MSARAALAVVTVIVALAPAGAAAQTPTASPRLKVPERLYAGYLGVFTLEDKAMIDDAEVALQRRAGSGWTTLVRQRRGSDETELFARLPGGRQTVRAVVTFGGRSFPVATKTLTVRRDAGRTTSRDDGRYRDPKPSGSSTLQFSVAGDGRTLRGFRASVTTFCFGPTIASNRIFVAFAGFDPIRIAPDGSVVGLLETKSGARQTLIGRLRRGRFTGDISVSLSTCSGSRELVAVRRR